MPETDRPHNAENFILLHTQTESGTVGRVVIDRQKMTAPPLNNELESSFAPFSSGISSLNRINRRDSAKER